MTENRNYYKSTKKLNEINNQCTHIYKTGPNKGTQCKKLTGINRYFCVEHFRYHSLGK